MSQKLKLVNLYKNNKKHRLYAIFSNEGYFYYYLIDEDVLLDLRDLSELGYSGRFENIPVFYKTYSMED